MAANELFITIKYDSKKCAIDLLSELVEHGFTAFYEYGDSDDCNYCFFCGEGQPNLGEIEKHKQDCIFLRAKELLQSVRFEVEQ